MDSERMTIASWQDMSEHPDFEDIPTRPKTDSSGCFGIQKQGDDERY